MESDVSLESNWDEQVISFKDMGLKDELLHGIFNSDFQRPYLVQQIGIRPLILGRDTIAQAQSGSGMTATFAIGLLQLIDISVNQCQVLVIAPTRELARDITQMVNKLGEFMHVKCHTCIESTALKEDIRTLERDVHAVVGSPGKVLDMLLRDQINTQSLKLLVLDDADEILARGFKEHIVEIAKKLPENIQVALSSITLPSEVVQMAEQFMQNPVCILSDSYQLSLMYSKQYYIYFENNNWKLDTLFDLYEFIYIEKSIIYCETTQRMEEVTQAMIEKDFPVSSLHREMEPSIRKTMIEEFRTGSTRVLVTTDHFLTRGIHPPPAFCIINYDMPTNYRNYLGRVGWSERYGKRGIAINFITGADVKFLHQVEQHYNIEIPELPFDLAEIY